MVLTNSWIKYVELWKRWRDFKMFIIWVHFYHRSYLGPSHFSFGSLSWSGLPSSFHTAVIVIFLKTNLIMLLSLHWLPVTYKIIHLNFSEWQTKSSVIWILPSSTVSPHFAVLCKTNCSTLGSQLKGMPSQTSVLLFTHHPELTCFLFFLIP